MEIIDALIVMMAEMAPYILLGFLIAGLIYAFVPQRMMAGHLAGSGWREVVKAALIGIPLPLCSCGVLPTAISMRRNGASRAASSSFLISTPQTGVDSIAATWALLGPAFAVIRPIAALVTAVFGGVAVGRVETDDPYAAADNSEAHKPSETFIKKLLSALRYGFVDLVSSIGTWLVAGLAIAALITVLVPSDALATLGDRPFLAMLAVLVVAIPMYVCATGSIPIAFSLMLKGLSPGTALVLLMAGPAANFASFTLISREFGRKAAWVYLVSIVAGALGFGLMIDYLLPASWFAIGARDAMACHTSHLSAFSIGCAAVLSGLLIYSFARRLFKPKKQFNDMTQKYEIQGMNCPHCQAAVKSAITSVEGVTSAEVTLRPGSATVEGNPDPEKVCAAVRSAGFDASLLG